MCAKSMYPSLLQYDNTIGMLYRRNSLCDNQLCRSRNFLRKRFAYLRVCGGIHSACRVVQNEYFRLFQQCSRNTKTLFLPAGYVGAALFDIRIVSIRHCFDKFVCTCEAAGPSALFLTGIQIAPAQIVIDRSGKQYVFLQYDRHLITQRFDIIASDIFAAYLHTACRHIVQAADQIDQTRFRAAGTADNSNRFAGMNIQMNIRQNETVSGFLRQCLPRVRMFLIPICRIRMFPIRTFAVTKIHMLKPDTSIRYAEIRLRRIFQRTFFI